MKQTLLKLHVNNHPGVLYRISGLFSRRAIALDGIFVSRLSTKGRSVLYVQFEYTEKIPVIIRHLEKDHDVFSVMLIPPTEADFLSFVKEIGNSGESLYPMIEPSPGQ